MDQNGEIIIYQSEDGLTHIEVKMEDETVWLTQQQPVARDMRTITAAMKMVTDMERIGDQAADIAELTVMLADHPYVLKADNPNNKRIPRTVQR